MIGLDTNVLVRLIIEDDKAQAALARTAVRNAVASGKRCFVSHVVLVEFAWVMESVFERTRPDICRFLDAILDSEDLCVKDEDVVSAALDHYRTGSFDFADALIALGNHARGCTTTLTFDRKAARLPEFQHLAQTSP
ncbi:type II toxin-antitoxin system VapC family toxin [Azospirillum agricola]|uniref:type II toxin-antitoxin system VapC family toxin n=1 Tax=Azospirillum agricola TaxID=1720247 RepID=UPI000A0F3D37|nr:type II toxin-antitoxin system VapC family toxin [Azospirillum agricola]SMH53040.1 Predicted nucleic-acid-binding protein, contains PIN domain [Azospirillum lipoferum]